MKIYEYIIRMKDQVTDKLRALRNMTISTMGGLRAMGGQLRSLGTDISNMFGLGLLKRFGPAAIVAGLGMIGKSAVTMAADLGQTQVGFEVMLGSAEKATNMIDDLRTMAKFTPFETMDLVRSTETMLAFGIAGEKVLPTLRMLGDVSRGNAEKLRLVSLAYSQIQAAGRLMGQDLWQLINAGFSPLQEISQKTGKSLSVLKKEMEDGEISADMVTAAFQSATSEGGRFFNMMEKQSKTFHGMAATLKDEWNEMLIDLGTRILPNAISGIKTLSSLLKDLTTSVDFTPLVLAFTSTRDVLGDLLGLFKEILTAMGFTVTQTSSLQLIVNALAFSLRMAFLPLRTLINGLLFWVEVVKMAVSAGTGLGKVLIGLKTFNIGLITEGAGQIKDAFVNGFENLKSRVTNFIKTEKEGLASIFTTGAKVPDLPGAGQQGSLGGGGTPDPNAFKATEGIDKITGGGRQAVNVTINLDNLIGVQNFDVKNIKESIRDMEKQTIEALIRVLNAGNYAASQ